MTSVGQRQMKTQQPADQANAPEKPLVQTNEQRFQWENAVLMATKSLRHEATAVAFYLSKSWGSKLKCCFPTVETMAFDLGISESAVSRSITCLARAGLIVRKKGRARSAKYDHNIYYLTQQKAPSMRRKLLLFQEIDMSELPASLDAEMPPEDADVPPTASQVGQESPSEETGRQNCLATRRQNCLTNYTTELQSGPCGPLSDSSQNDLDFHARETDKLGSRDAPGARPDQPFREKLEPRQLAFYDKLDDIDRYRYRKLDADRRDEFEIVWDIRYGGDGDD